MCVAFLQAVRLLAELLTADSQVDLWSSDSAAAKSVAVASSFLLDLLDMHSIRKTELSLQSPHNYIWYCTGQLLLLG